MAMLKNILPRLPVWIASLLMILLTALWTFWGTAEMYHEGWWGAWYNRLLYLAPVAVMLIPALVAFRWPMVGGILICAVGLFATFAFGFGVSLIGIAITFVGGLFIVDGIVKRRTPVDHPRGTIWWYRKGRYYLLLGLPVFIIILVSAYNLPVVISRVDDGERGARLLEGNGISLVWAPEGPGWNWRQPWGGYPSWQDVALYGVSPLGIGGKPGYGPQAGAGEPYRYASEEDMRQTNLCRYLSADGLELMDKPRDIWRMPTTDEVVRSLVHHGQNAGCEWNGEFRKKVKCTALPDKESPLWATDQPAIYYWTADSRSDESGYFVSYNGMVNATGKNSANSRHSYRCVREP